MTPEEELRVLGRGTVDFLVADELLAKLRSGRKLKVKAGFDPTRPDLHLGHTVVLTKLRQFQDFGHHVVFVVGDFTAAIGDPTGKSATRPVPTREEIEEGARSYAEQAFKVLDPALTTVAFNKEWLGKLSFDDVIRLAGKYTLARMMERDDFSQRWKENTAISMHELLYPLAQGYDSVHLESDIELGGTDQLFNLLVGRHLMRESGLCPQVVMTMPLLEGTNARFESGRIVGDKMSKSLDNYVGVDEPPKEQFGKLMSISDDLMWHYYELLSLKSESEIEGLQMRVQEGVIHPKTAKSDLAKEIITRFYSSKEAEAAESQWNAQFAQGKVPADIKEFTLPAEEGEIWLPKALVASECLSSTSEARRRIKQGAVSVDGQKVSSLDAQLKAGKTYTIKAGKRDWVRIKVQ